MVAFGAGEVLGCYFIGWVVDKFGSKKTAYVNIGVCIAMTAATSV